MIVLASGDWRVAVSTSRGRWISRPLRWRAAWRLALSHRHAGRRAWLTERI